MRTIGRTLCFVALVAAPTAVRDVSARQGLPPVSRSVGAGPLSAVDELVVPAIDAAAAAVDDDRRAVNGGPLGYALTHDVEIGTHDRGTWELLADGRRLWRLRVHAPGATDLNFGFGRFHLPAGAMLHLVSEADGSYEGPYTHLDNEVHGQLWTPVVRGDRAVIELIVAPQAEFAPVLVLNRVGRGYRDLFRRGFPGVPKSGACNNDVICPEGDPWRDEIRSVARWSVSGGLLCTGTLVNAVAADCRPYFLSANHCGATAGNAASAVLYWNFEASRCDGNRDGSLADTQTGATFRAANAASDFVLLELDDFPDPAFNVHYAGWDNSGAAAAGSVGIHHPNSDEKAISFNTDPLVTNGNCGSPNLWQVDNWEDGTTEPGSSGSGLWDPDTHLIVGTLSGGAASCNDILFDCYGKFSVSWNFGGTPATRLSDWLDPAATGASSVVGQDCVCQAAASVDAPATACVNDVVTLDGSASTLAGCPFPATPVYEWFRDGVPLTTGPSTTTVMEPVPGAHDYDLVISCSSDSTCTSTTRVTVDFVDCVPCSAQAFIDPAPADACAGMSVDLDAGGSIVTDCPAPGVPTGRWLRDGVPDGTGPAYTALELVEGTHTYTVEIGCSTDATCVDTADHVIRFDPDGTPLDVGNTMRGLRLGNDVEMQWTDPQALAFSWTMYRATAKSDAGVPTPDLVTTSLVDPGAVATPPDRYFYNVKAVSCSGIEGP